MKIRNLKVVTHRWRGDVDYRRAMLADARTWARQTYGLVRVMLDDGTKTVMATIDARFWEPLPVWMTAPQRPKGWKRPSGPQ